MHVICYANVQGYFFFALLILLTGNSTFQVIRVMFLLILRNLLDVFEFNKSMICFTDQTVQLAVVYVMRFSGICI